MKCAKLQIPNDRINMLNIHENVHNEYIPHKKCHLTYSTI